MAAQCEVHIEAGEREGRVNTDSEQEDLCGGDDINSDSSAIREAEVGNHDDTLVVERGSVRDGIPWIEIPTQVVRDIRGHDGSTHEAMHTVTRCLGLNIAEIREGPTQEMLMAAQERDTRMVSRMRGVIAGMILDRSLMETTTLQYVRLEAVRIVATERDVEVHFLSFVLDGDTVTVVVTTRGLGNKVQEARNTEHSYTYLLTRRLHRCITMLQEGPGRDGGYPQDVTTVPVEYGDVAVADDRYYDYLTSII